MNRTAADVPTCCLAPGENIALLFRPQNPTSVTQRIVAVEPALAHRKTA
jgi:hypothetical protein